jgi:hypothetical protein
MPQQCTSADTRLATLTQAASFNELKLSSSCQQELPKMEV